MGKCLAVGLAIKIVAEKCDMVDHIDYVTNEEIFEGLSENFDLELYEKNYFENDYFIILEMRKEVIEKEIVLLMQEIYNLIEINRENNLLKKIRELKNKNYTQMMEIAKLEQPGFCFSNGDIATLNNTTYITQTFGTHCDLIYFLDVQRTNLEFNFDLFRFFRNCIIKNLKSPLRKSIIVTESY